MKKLITLSLSLLAVAVLAAELDFTYKRLFTDQEARGIRYAAKQFNAEQKAKNTNWVDVTARQYFTARIDELAESYSRSADAATDESLRTELTLLRQSYREAAPAKRTNMLQTATQP